MRLRLLLSTLLESDPPAIELLHALNSASVDVRKTVITLCRCRVFPEKYTEVYRRTRSQLRSFIVIHRDSGPVQAN